MRVGVRGEDRRADLGRIGRPNGLGLAAGSLLLFNQTVMEQFADAAESWKVRPAPFGATAAIRTAFGAAIAAITGFGAGRVFRLGLGRRSRRSGRIGLVQRRFGCKPQRSGPNANHQPQPRHQCFHGESFQDGGGRVRGRRGGNPGKEFLRTAGYRPLTQFALFQT